MMVSDAEIDAINITHKGNIVQDVLDGSHRLIAETQKSLGTVRNWTQLQLTDGEQHAFASAAHTLRFADADGKVTTPITADQLLQSATTRGRGQRPVAHAEPGAGKRHRWRTARQSSATPTVGACAVSRRGESTGSI